MLLVISRRTHRKNMSSILTHIEERERLLSERAKALAKRERVMDEREEALYRRENSFERQNLEQEWGDLVHAQSKLYQLKQECLQSSLLDEREAELKRKRRKLNQWAGQDEDEDDD
jgi:hypothetical protein